MTYSPKFQKQLDGSPTASSDCGVRSASMGIDWATDGAKVPNVADFRRRAGTVGDKPNTTATLQKGVQSYDTAAETNGYKPLKATRKLQAPHSELDSLAGAGRWLTLSIDYGVVNDRRPDLSGDRAFRGGHSVGLLGRRVFNGTVEYKIWDPLADGRRDGIPKGPKWWPRTLVQKATEKFAQKSGAWTGLLQINSNPVEDPTPPEPPEPPKPPKPTPEEVIARLTKELNEANGRIDGLEQVIDDLETRIVVSVGTLTGADAVMVAAALADSVESGTAEEE